MTPRRPAAVLVCAVLGACGRAPSRPPDGDERRTVATASAPPSRSSPEVRALEAEARRARPTRAATLARARAPEPYDELDDVHIRELRRLKRAALEALVDVVFGAQPVSQKRFALEIYRKIAPAEDFVELLRFTLAHGTAEARAAVYSISDSASRIEHEVMQAVADDVGHADVEVRRWALLAVARSALPFDVRRLKPSLRHADDGVRLTAATIVLRNAPDRALVDELVQELATPVDARKTGLVAEALATGLRAHPGLGDVVAPPFVRFVREHASDAARPAPRSPGPDWSRAMSAIVDALVATDRMPIDVVEQLVSARHYSFRDDILAGVVRSDGAAALSLVTTLAGPRGDLLAPALEELARLHPAECTDVIPRLDRIEIRHAMDAYFACGDAGRRALETRSTTEDRFWSRRIRWRLRPMDRDGVVRDLLAEGWIGGIPQTPAEGRTLELPLWFITDALEASGRLIYFDAESSMVPPRHDVLLEDVARACGPAFRPRAVLQDGQPDDLRVRFVHDDTIFEFAPDSSGDWYDVNAVLGAGNDALAAAGRKERLIFLDGGDQIVEVLCVDPARWAPFARDYDIDWVVVERGKLVKSTREP